MNRPSTAVYAACEQRFHGLDYLRALMAIAVIAWHAHLFGDSAAFDLDKWRGHSLELSDVINFNFLLLAVPTFFIISMFLFFTKAHLGPAYLRRRLGHLAILYIFWSGVWVYALHKNAATLHSLKDPRFLLRFLVSGGESIFYFFFSLMLVTCLAWLVRRLSNKLLAALLAASMVLLYAAATLALCRPNWWPLVAYWNPLNFLAYAFVGALIWRYWQTDRFRQRSIGFWVCLALLGVAFLALSCVEWRLLRSQASVVANGYMIPAATRFSVVVGATILVVLSLGIRYPAPLWVKALSDCSLGIYCIHIFVINANLVHRVSALSAVQFLLVVIISLAAVKFARMALRTGII